MVAFMRSETPGRAPMHDQLAMYKHVKYTAAMRRHRTKTASDVLCALRLEAQLARLLGVQARACGTPAPL